MDREIIELTSTLSVNIDEGNLAQIALTKIIPTTQMLMSLARPSGVATEMETMLFLEVRRTRGSSDMYLSLRVLTLHPYQNSRALSGARTRGVRGERIAGTTTVSQRNAKRPGGFAPS